MGLLFQFRESDLSLEPLEIYRRLGKGPGVLLESARVAPPTGRFSLAAKRPFLTFTAKGRACWTRTAAGTRRIVGRDPLKALEALLDFYAVSPAPDFLFAGGAAGFFGYEVKNLIETGLPQTAVDDLGLPDILFHFFDEGVWIDHLKRKAFLFAGVRSQRNAGRYAEKKLDGLARRLSRPAPALEKNLACPLSRSDIRSSLPAEEFMEKVIRAKRYIRAGDIYQANLSQRLTFAVEKKAETVYAALKKINPSSFFGILDAGDFQIVSGSPERLLSLEGGQLQTRPIAGTRARKKDSRADRRVDRELLLSEKERAEHIMLVDLERNDLGRVSEYGSVSVDELMGLEEYSHVKHIVSNVRSKLKKGFSPIDALKAFFPGGTITGAPKVRCMQIIDELEPVARGPYTGSLGYFGFGGNMDFNILIRSLVLRDGVGHLHVGAGIVADSDPKKEYDETLHKAHAVLAAVFGEKNVRAYFKSLGLAAA